MLALKVLKWFEHVDHMTEECLTEKMYESTVHSRSALGRTYRKCLDVVKNARIAESLELRDAMPYVLFFITLSIWSLCT